MTSKSLSVRFALWVAVFALLLKAAVPMLATASALAQGKTLVEVCTVYGVATLALDEQGSQPQTEHGSAHAGEHCALTAVLALAAPDLPVPAVLPVSTDASASPLAQPSPQAPDACATWVARLKHGPPNLS